MNKLIAFLLSSTGLDKREVPVAPKRVFYPQLQDALPFEPDPNPFACQNGEAPPISNEFVASGCEQFGKTEVEYPNRQVQEGRFVWETNKGDLLLPADMATEHLFYSLRMLFNHSMPPLARVGQFKRHKDVFKWPNAYKIQASNAMILELRTRKDVEAWMRDEMSDMNMNTEFVVVALHRPGEHITQIVDSSALDAVDSLRHALARADNRYAHDKSLASRKKKFKRKAAKRAKKRDVRGYYQFRNGKRVLIKGYKR